MISSVSPRCTVTAVPPSQRKLPSRCALPVDCTGSCCCCAMEGAGAAGSVRGGLDASGVSSGRGSIWATGCCGRGAGGVLGASLGGLSGLENGSLLKREVSELQPAAKAAINPMPRMRARPRCKVLRIRMATHSKGYGTAGVNAERVNVGLRKSRQGANFAYFTGDTSPQLERGRLPRDQRHETHRHERALLDRAVLLLVQPLELL